VHTLASAYGWRESDILNLSPWRRQLYLTLVNG
ncbi:MAG TPA: phage baseplate protein, partial [Blastocatellia bacterium]|nr:phage baseplate protein [Blastocatellia bacterium]